MVDFSGEGIGKHYGVTEVLHGCSLELHGGRITGLVGSNGAGKSTLIRILCGVERPDYGRLLWDGEEVSFAGPRDASRRGIKVVHQSIALGLLPGKSVAENLMLQAMAEKRCPRIVTRAWLERAASEMLGSGLFSFDLTKSIDELSVAERQEVILARAIAEQVSVIILDEPTASLSAREAGKLFERLQHLRDQDVAVMLVSHRLGEVSQISDEAFVLRDGRVVDRLDTRDGGSLDTQRMAMGIIGAAQTPQGETGGSIFGEGSPVSPAALAGGVALEGVGMRVQPAADEVDICIRYGEVLGLTGLVGSGKTELLEQLVGVRPLVDGKVRYQGVVRRRMGVASAIASGVGFVPEDRTRMAVFPGWPIGRHRSIPFLKRFSRYRIVRRQEETRAGEELVEKFGIRGGHASTPLDALSGGNQQKVVVTRWLAEGADVLVLDEPFTGVDIGARGDIGAQLKWFASEHGKAVLVASSDPREVVEVADRVMVLVGGRVSWEGPVDNDTLNKIGKAIAGGGEKNPPATTVGEL